MKHYQESITRATLVIFIAHFSSRILGFLREMLIAHFFGARAITDSYLVATVLPATIAGLIGGALSTVFIPLFIEVLNTQGEEKAWEGARVVLLSSALYLLGGLFVAYLVSPFFIKTIAPGFDRERLALSLTMSNIMLPSLFFSGMLGLLIGIIQSYRVFTLPALAGLLFNTCLISFLVLGRSYPSIGLSLGYLSGAFIQFFLLLVFLRKFWHKGKFHFSFSHPLLLKVWRLMLPIFLGTGVGYLNLIVDRIFASLLPVGTIAALNFAVRVKEIPAGLFGLPLSQSTYPSLSLYATTGEIRNLRDLFSRSLETLWLFVVPSMVGLFVLPQETIRFLFERGAFSSQATIITSQALSFYVLGLFATSSLEIVGRVFYSFQDTRTPVKISVLGLLLNIFLNFALIKPLAHRGLALATSLSATFMFLVLLEILRRKIGGIEGKVLLKNLGKIILASLGMGMIIFFLRPFANQWWGYLIVLAAGIGSYGGLTVLLRPRSSEKIIVTVKKRIRKFLR